MRQETIIKTYLKFDELDEEQKTKVLDSLRDINFSYDWYLDDISQWKNDLENLGFNNVKINFSGFSSQGDGLSFTGKFVKEKLNIKKFRENNGTEYWIEFSEKLQQLNCDDTESIERVSLRYYHENTVTSNNEEFLELCRELMRKLYESLESQYYFLQSDEAVRETIEINDYDFDSDTLKIS